MPKLDRPAFTHRLLLLGYLGGRNLGDDAMLIALLRRLPSDREVVVLARDPSQVRLPDDVLCAVVLERAGLWSAVRRILWADTVVRVGGTSFHDEYTSSRRTALNYTRLCGLYALSRFLRRRVIHLGIGVGTVTRRSTRVLLGLATKSASLIVTRDVLSAERLARYRSPKHLTGVDLVMVSYPPLRHERRGTAKGVALSVVDLAPFDSGVDSDQYWWTLAESLVSRFPDRQLYVLAFKDNERESDVPPAQRLVDRLNRAGIAATLVSYDQGLEAFLAVFENCDVAVATRYHSLVFALHYSCDAYVVPYNSKLRALAADVGLPESRMIPTDAAEVRDWTPESWEPKMPRDFDARLAALDAVVGSL